ncbi:MAG: ATP-binding protein [Desulfuromonadales bacterium]|nr:ATP-binding protein [Desulfuromonadales bacterium]
MAKPVGLRTEIIVNVIILLGAALLFSGFLLLKLTERELVAQQIAAFSATAEIFAASLSLPPEKRDQGEPQPLPTSVPVDAWSLVDDTLAPIEQESSRPDFILDMNALQTVRQTLENSTRLSYDSPAWFGSNSEGHFLISVPLVRGGQFVGAVQLRFSLAEMAMRIRAAQRWFIGYVLIFGILLSGCGFYLLNRNVVRPIGRLRIATERIAAGDLEQTPQVTGPREIAELSAAFATMVTALKESRAESEEHIASLEAANSELRNAQQRLARSEKLATVGHLAAGMAHELGNPLGAVSGYLALIRSEPDATLAQELAERAMIEITRIDRLVRDLLDYARPADETLDDVDINEVTTAAVEFLRHQGIFDSRQFACTPATTPATVRIDRHRLQQVLVNLLLNARDATADGGQIVLTTAIDHDAVKISVRDDGCGMPPEVLAHIFDPFYTTKDPDQGRGLGLAVCARIIDDAKGRIDVDSAPGKGTLLTLTLPLVE